MKITLLIAGLLALAACADAPEIEKPYAERTQRERDSVIAESKLPGAPLVKKAMKISDAQSRRMAELDELTEQ
jgi:hypothetical protein